MPILNLNNPVFEKFPPETQEKIKTMVVRENKIWLLLASQGEIKECLGNLSLEKEKIHPENQTESSPNLVQNYRSTLRNWHYARCYRNLYF